MAAKVRHDWNIFNTTQLSSAQLMNPRAQLFELQIPKTETTTTPRLAKVTSRLPFACSGPSDDLTWLPSLGGAQYGRILVLSRHDGEADAQRLDRDPRLAAG